MKVGGYISEHDFTVAERVAHVLCGGDVDPNSLVDEAWMMTLEREAFLHLLTQPKTQERIAGLLKPGKPVRNYGIASSTLQQAIIGAATRRTHRQAPPGLIFHTRPPATPGTP